MSMRRVMGWLLGSMALLLTCLLGNVGEAMANSGSDYPNFQNRYPSVANLFQCGACHVSIPGLNAYGRAYKAAGRNAQALVTIEPNDSDGDGFSNIIEIGAATAPWDPASKPARVTVSKSGDPNGGTVTGRVPARPDVVNAINCGSLCATAFPAGFDVMLSATPSSNNFHFAGWSVPSPPGQPTNCGANLTCSFKLTQDSAVTAAFAPGQLFSLNVGTLVKVDPFGATTGGQYTNGGGGKITSTPTAIECSTSSCAAEFVGGTTVRLTAMPDAGFVFAGWLIKDECPGFGACTVTMGTTPSKTVRAIFSRQAWTDTMGDIGLPHADIVGGLAAVNAGMVDLRVTFKALPFRFDPHSRNAADVHTRVFWCLNLDGKVTTGAAGLCGIGTDRFITISSMIDDTTGKLFLTSDISGLDLCSHVSIDLEGRTLRVVFPLSLLSDDGVFDYTVQSMSHHDPSRGSQVTVDHAPDSSDFSRNNYYSSHSGVLPPFNGRSVCGGGLGMPPPAPTPQPVPHTPPFVNPRR